MANVLALCSKKEKSWLDQTMVKRLQYSQENLMSEVKASEPNVTFFLRLDD